MILGVSEKKDMSEACARFISWTQFGPLGLFGPLNAKQNLYWRVMEEGGVMWILKCHVKPRWQPFHPLKGTLPCGAAADLELLRVQVRFGPTGNRSVLEDSWMDPVLKNREEKWTGYTLFRMRRAPTTAPTASGSRLGPRAGYLGNYQGDEGGHSDLEVMVGRRVHIQVNRSAGSESGPRLHNYADVGEALGMGPYVGMTSPTPTTESSMVHGPARSFAAEDQPVVSRRSETSSRYGRPQSIQARGQAVMPRSFRPGEDHDWELVTEDEEED